MIEDEMVGWYRRLNGHEFGWTPGVGPGLKVSWGLFFLTNALLFGIIISKHFKSCPSYRNPSIREHSYLRKLVLDTHSGDLGDQL